LFKSGAVEFKRVSFSKLFAQHTMNRIEDKSLSASRTLIAFCGSPRLSNRVKEAKILNDLYLFMTEWQEHEMEITIESYGGTKSKKSEKALEESGT